MNPIFARPHNRKRNRLKRWAKAQVREAGVQLLEGLRDIFIAAVAVVVMVLVVALFVVMPWWGALLILILACTVGEK